MNDAILLRDITEADLPVLFEAEIDPIAMQMAAFTSREPLDWPGFNARWGRIQADPGAFMKCILINGELAGSIGSYLMDDKRQVCYWIFREHWGRGIATTALGLLLEADVTTRPVFASAAADNLGSIKVLEKCGFKVEGSEKAFANARREEVEEVFFRLD